MNDLYLELANTQIGQYLFQTLNLPKPVQLKRSEKELLSAPDGSVLIAATKNNLALQNIFKALIHDDSTVFTIRASKTAFVAVPTAFKADIEDIHIDNINTCRFKSFIFDASGFSSPDELKSMYQLFKVVIKRISRNGKIVIVGKDPEHSDNPEQSATQGALLGFCKSISKETGKKGITCNVLYLQKGAQKYIQAPLYFFAGSKSAFITGQSITLLNNTLKPEKVNWACPLKGKIAVVTGAAQGIGYETAKVLARDGATVVCLDIPANEGAIKQLADSISGHSLAIDLSDASAPEKLASAVGAQLGVIDIIVHNAGITRDKTIANMPEHFWDQVIDINFKKVIQINQVLFQKKAFSPRARIICISSISGIAGNFGQSNYACSKAGIASYVRALSQGERIKQSDGVTVNAIAPGFIETQMTQKIPLLTREFGRRLSALSQGGLPLDIAEGISFFCHPASQAVSGNVLRICGQSLLGR